MISGIATGLFLLVGAGSCLRIPALMRGFATAQRPPQGEKALVGDVVRSIFWSNMAVFLVEYAQAAIKREATFCFSDDSARDHYPLDLNNCPERV